MQSLRTMPRSSTHWYLLPLPTATVKGHRKCCRSWAPAQSQSGMTDEGVDGPNRRVAPMVTLDRWLSRNPRNAPYLVKIDVDGAEMRVLQGAAETLKNASVVVIETPKAEFTPRIAFLQALGFDLFDLTEPCYYDKSFWQCDAVMLRTELQRKHFAQLKENFVPSKYEAFHLPR